MRHTFAPIAALLLAVALLLMGNGLLGTLIPVRGQIEAFSTFSIALLGSTYFLGFAVGCLYGPVLVRRVGHIRTFTAMASLVSAVSLGHGLIALPLPWWGMRAVTGFCFAVLYIVVESWLNERSSNQNRGTVLSAYLFINLTVITIGQMMLTLSDPAELTLFALTSILVSVAVLPVALSAAAAPEPIETVRVRMRHLIRTSPTAFTGCLGVGLTNGAFWTLAPLFVQRSGFGVTAVALFMSATVLGGAAGQWPAGLLSDRMDRGRLIVIMCLLSLLMGAAVVAAGGLSLPWLLGAAAAWGACAFPLYAVTVAQANDRAQPSEFVEVSSGLLLTYAAGAVVGPMIATGLMNTMRPGGLYVFTLLVHMLVAIVAVVLLRRERPVPEEEHVAFTDALQAAGT
ncbi:MAG TPA: MFS transporter, partial [Arenicellales bacterium]|nr:MFS transporter [Arenicellales bacterium]